MKVWSWNPIAAMFILAACGRPPDPVSVNNSARACGDPRVVFTPPGRVTADAPTLPGLIQQGEEVIEPEPGAAVEAEQLLARLRQSPEPGTRLTPGEYTFVVSDDAVAEPLCSVPVTVVLDPDAYATPFFEYVAPGVDGVAEVGEVPALELGDLVDELGNPIQVSLLVDELPVTGLSLAAAAATFRTPGVHVTSLLFLDAFGRRGRINFFGLWAYAGGSLAPVLTGTQGVKAGCTCGLFFKDRTSKDCKEDPDAPGDGKESYQCLAEDLLSFASEVSDFGGESDAQASADGGFDKRTIYIGCRRGTGAFVENCVDCCEKPVMMISVDAHIAPLHVYAQNGDDSAVLRVTVSGSGFGTYSLQSGVASGFDTYELERGATVGGTAGIGKAKEGVTGRVELSASKATKETYDGKSFLWTKAPPQGPVVFTAWAESCSREHILNVSFSAKILATTRAGALTKGLVVVYPLVGVPLFYLFHDDAEARLIGTAGSSYTGFGFTCNGNVPRVIPPQ